MDKYKFFSTEETRTYPPGIARSIEGEIQSTAESLIKKAKSYADKINAGPRDYKRACKYYLDRVMMEVNKDSLFK